MIRVMCSGRIQPAFVLRAFEKGDAVVVRNGSGREIGRGLSAYSAADARRIIGHKSREIEAILGYRGREELIHRDDLVVGVAPDNT